MFLLSGMDDESSVHTEVQILFAISVYVQVGMNEANLLVRIFMRQTVETCFVNKFRWQKKLGLQ